MSDEDEIILLGREDAIQAHLPPEAKDEPRIRIHHCPEVIESFKRLADTGCVEFLAETYYHSLAFLFSRAEFEEQVALQQ